MPNSSTPSGSHSQSTFLTFSSPYFTLQVYVSTNVMEIKLENIIFSWFFHNGDEKPHELTSFQYMVQQFLFSELGLKLLSTSFSYNKVFWKKRVQWNV